MMSLEVLDLSRLQFALTAMYHFIFVPLTLGLVFILVIMESLYVMSGKVIYKAMCQFWGKLFAINFAMGVATGIAMEFQFGTNWSYYSYYVGDIFGPALAIEGLMAFFLESTLVGLMFFGWDRLSKVQHLCVTCLVALGTNLSALWILIANAWMQYPVGGEFNYMTMRMELSSFFDVMFNPVAQVKFVHTVAAGYVTASVFVLSISAYYLLRKEHIPFAKRSFAVASAFGMASILSVIVLGDESGYEIGEIQKAKLAMIEAEWETEMPPASFSVLGWIDSDNMATHYAVKIPYVMGLIATRSITKEVVGIKDLKSQHRQKIILGREAYVLLQKVKKNSAEKIELEQFDELKQYLGYGLLLKKYRDDIENATDLEIEQATDYSIPSVGPIFWTFRVMVGIAFILLFLIAGAFYQSGKQYIEERPWLLKGLIYALPLPWVAILCGWFIAEYGRQPWTIAEVLPTYLSVSDLTVSQLYFSLFLIGVFYSFALIIEIFLMLKYIKIGPSLFLEDTQ